MKNIAVAFVLMLGALVVMAIMVMEKEKEPPPHVYGMLEIAAMKGNDIYHCGESGPFPLICNWESEGTTYYKCPCAWQKPIIIGVGK